MIDFKLINRPSPSVLAIQLPDTSFDVTAYSDTWELDMRRGSAANDLADRAKGRVRAKDNVVKEGHIAKVGLWILVGTEAKGLLQVGKNCSIYW